MDSNAYKYLIADIIRNTPKLTAPLPVQFNAYDIALSNDNFKAVAYFLTQLVPEFENNSSEKPVCPSILNESDKNFFAVLFRTVHQKLAQELGPDKGTDALLFKRNGTELLTFLSHAVTRKWIPIFSGIDALSFAMSCFLLEACMNIGWCPNAFENRAKRAAHLYFSLLKKSLHNANDAECSTILGYLQSAWLCAQKTEGIQDRTLEWENKNLIHHYSWEIAAKDTVNKINCTMFRFFHPSVFLIIPKYPNCIPHPFRNLTYEGKAGLTLFFDGKPITSIEQIDSTFIDRPKFKGVRLTYTCITATAQQIKWIVAIQIFESTVYRIDVIQPLNETCTVSDAELRLENSIPLSKISNNEYTGKERNNIVIEFVKNPFSLDYSGQEESWISLFQGKKRVISTKASIEMITAWSYGKHVTSIDRTNLLGIFDLAE